MTRFLRFSNRHLRIAGVVAALLLAGTAGANAQVMNLPAVCLDHDSMTKRLANDYREAPASIGLTNTGSVLEFFASAEGTWSVVVTNPGGVSCLIMSGENWESINTVSVVKPNV